MYSAYGLRLLSDDSIPGLMPYEGSDAPDVRIWLNQMPSWWNEAYKTESPVSYSTPETGALIIRRPDRSGWHFLRYLDGAEFLINPLEGELWSKWPPEATLEDALPYLVGPVLGFVLRMREVCCLHASAVAIEQGSIAFVGPHGAGKSTTAAAFAKLGHAAVSDDIVALQEEAGRFLVKPGYPRLCLWPDAAEGLYGSVRALPRICPEDGMSHWWDKRYLDLTSAEYTFQRSALKLSAIYMLEPRTDAPDRPRVTPMPAQAALVRLVGNTFMNYLLDRDLRSKEFRFLSRLVATVPIRGVTPHPDHTNLPALCEAILEDCAGLAGARAAEPEPESV